MLDIPWDLLYHEYLSEGYCGIFKEKQKSPLVFGALSNGLHRYWKRSLSFLWMTPETSHLLLVRGARFLPNAAKSCYTCHKEDRMHHGKS